MTRSKRPDRFPQKSCAQSLMSARGLGWMSVTVKPVRSGLVKSLRGRMDAPQFTRQMEGLFESMFSQSFGR